MNQSFVAGFLCALVAFNAFGAQQEQHGAEGWLATPFEAGSGLPKTFQGHDYRMILAALKKSPPPVKSEFETEEAFSRRYDKWVAKPLFGTVKPTDQFAIVMDTLFPAQDRPIPSSTGVVAYDAEAEIMAIRTGFQCEYSAGLRIDTVAKGRDTYVGQNAFGVKKLVARERRETICVRPVSSVDFNATFKVSPESAMRLKSSGKMLIVGTLADPLLSADYAASEATISNPRETLATIRNLHMNIRALWFYDGVTKRVFHKQSIGDQSGGLISVGPGCTPPQGSKIAGIWTDGGTGAIWTIWNSGAAWSLAICPGRGGRVMLRTLNTENDEARSFNWIEDGGYQGRTYKIEENGDLGLYDKQERFQVMRPKSQRAVEPKQ